MSEEKVLTLRGKRAVWAPGGGSGPIDPKRLPEGYPYKEQSESEIVVLAEETITPAAMGGGYIGQLSVVPNLEIGKEYIVRLNGEEYKTTAFENPNTGTACLSDNGTLPATVFGVQIVNGSAAVMTYAAGSYTVSISTIGMTETIHPMAPEFLPAGVGGGVQVVTLTQTGNGTYTSSHTGAEIAEMARKGTVIADVVTTEMGNGVATFSSLYEGAANFIWAIIASGAALALIISVPENDTAATSKNI